MATINFDAADTLQTLNGLYKTIYGSEGVQDSIPDSSKLQKLIPFKGGMERLGANYAVPIVLSPENGITFGGSAGLIFDLNSPISMNLQQATVTSDAHVLTAGFSFAVAAHSVTSEAAFTNGPGLIMENATKSISNVIEMELLYGQAATGLAGVASVNSISSTSIKLNITPTEWNGYFYGRKGLRLDFVNSANGTVVNTAGPLSIASVNVTTKTITITGIAADITAITTLYGASGAGFVTWAGSLGNQFIGLNYMFNNTTVPMFGIDPTTNDLWQANSYDVQGNHLTWDALGEGLAQAQERGLEENIKVLVPPRVWKFLNDSAPVSQRVFDKSYDPANAAVGAKGLTYYTNGVEAEIIGHNYVKAGEAYAFNADDFIRVGATPVGFNIPGSGYNDDIFFPIQGKAGFQVTCYGDEAPMPLKLATSVVFKNINPVGTGNS